MVDKKKLKRRVRAEKSRTGETYMQARDRLYGNDGSEVDPVLIMTLLVGAATVVTIERALSDWQTLHSDWLDDPCQVPWGCPKDPCPDRAQLDSQCRVALLGVAKEISHRGIAEAKIDSLISHFGNLPIEECRLELQAISRSLRPTRLQRVVLKAAESFVRHGVLSEYYSKGFLSVVKTSLGLHLN